MYVLPYTCYFRVSNTLVEVSYLLAISKPIQNSFYDKNIHIAYCTKFMSDCVRLWFYVVYKNCNHLHLFNKTIMTLQNQTTQYFRSSIKSRTLHCTYATGIHTDMMVTMLEQYQMVETICTIQGTGWDKFLFLHENIKMISHLFNIELIVISSIKWGV